MSVLGDLLRISLRLHDGPPNTITTNMSTSHLAAAARLVQRNRLSAAIALIICIGSVHLLLADRLTLGFVFPERASQGLYRPLHDHRLALGPFLKPWTANLHGLLHDDGSFLNPESVTEGELEALGDTARIGLQVLDQMHWKETEPGQAARTAIDRGTMDASRRNALAEQIERLMSHYAETYAM